MCPNDETILLYSKNSSGEWKQVEKLEAHDQLVMAMDWYSDGITERLLSVSADRNGYVWSRPCKGGPWEKTLVLLRLKRGATCARWSKDGNKFAVGSAEGLVSVCTFEEEENWWTSKHLKAADGSAVLAIDWHPSGSLLAISTISGRVHLLSTFIKAIDGHSGEAPWKSFDEVIGVYEMGAWIHDLSFSPDGTLLAMASHDSQIHVINLSNGEENLVGGEHKWPLRHCRFITDNLLTFAYFLSKAPMVATLDGNGKWKYEGTLSGSAAAKPLSNAPASPSSTVTGASNEDTRGAFGGALAKFKAMDSRGFSMQEATSSTPSSKLSSMSRKSATSKHFSTISEIRLMPNNTTLATSGFDGRLILWDLSPLGARLGFQNLGINH